jgi:hypothetical protein
MDDVSLPPGAGDRQQVVVQHEDAELGVGRKLLLDPRVAAATDDAVVEVGLRGVDGHERDAVLAQHGRARADQLLEMHIADVAGVVVARDRDHIRTVQAVEVRAGLGVLLPVAEGRQVA